MSVFATLYFAYFVLFSCFFSPFLWIVCLKSLSQLSNIDLRMTHAIYNKCPPDINVTEHSASYTKASFLFIKQYRTTRVLCLILFYQVKNKTVFKYIQNSHWVTSAGRSGLAVAC